MGAYDDILDNEAPSRRGTYDDILGDEALGGERLLKETEQAPARKQELALKPRVTSAAPLSNEISLVPTSLRSGLAVTQSDRDIVQREAELLEQNKELLRTKGFKSASASQLKHDKAMQEARTRPLQALQADEDGKARVALRRDLGNKGLSDVDIDAEVKRQFEVASAQRDADEEFNNEQAALEMQKGLAPDRTWGDAGNDALQATLQGGLGIAAGGSWLLGALSPFDTDGFTLDMLNRSEMAELNKSQKTQLSNKLLEQAKVGKNMTAALIGNPLGVMDMILQSAPLALPGIAAGRGAAVIAARQTAKRLGERGAAKAAGQKAIASAAEKWAGRAGVASEAAISGGMGGAQAEKQVNETPFVMLEANSERYRELQKTMGAAEARAQLAKEVGLASAILQGAGTAMGGALARKVNDKLGLEQTYSQAVGKPMSAQGVVRGVLGELTEETAQSPLEQMGGNIGQMRADNNTGLMDDVAESTVLGGIAGLGQGGATIGGGAALYHARGGTLGEITRAMDDQANNSRFATPARDIASGLLDASNAQLQQATIRPVNGAPGLVEHVGNDNVPPFEGAVPVQVGNKTYWGDPSAVAAMNANAAAMSWQQQNQAPMQSPAFDGVSSAIPAPSPALSDAGAGAYAQGQSDAQIRIQGLDPDFLRSRGLAHLIPEQEQPALALSPALGAQTTPAEALNPALQDVQTPESGSAATESNKNQSVPQKNDVVLQNRNRSDAGYVQQMTRIAANPDAGRLGFSRDFSSGAPVILQDTADIPDSQKGRVDFVVTAEGRRIPVQYAVVEAKTLLPSNRADGTAIHGYEDGIQGMSRVVAGSGRTAALQKAWQQGTAAGYADGVSSDTHLHEVRPASVNNLDEPTLVRIMSPNDVTENIGDESNVSGVAQKSAIENARDDARRVDLTALTFGEDGEITAESVRQFVRSMPVSEQTGMLGRGGQPTTQAVDRLMGAIFHHAYGSDALTELFAQATDPDARNVLKGLAIAAPSMMQLNSDGIKGTDLDIRDLVSEAAQAVVNAQRRGQKLVEFLNQTDIEQSPEITPILRMFAENSRSAKRMGDILQGAAEFAYDEATRDVSGGLFGDTAPRATKQQVLERIHDSARSQNLGQQRGAIADGSHAQASAADPRASGNSAKTQGKQQDSTAREQGQQGRVGTDDFALTAQTEEELAQREAAQQQAEADRQAREQKASQKAQADKDRNDFTLTGSDSAIDEAEARGQGNMFDAPSVRRDDYHSEPSEAQKKAGNYKKEHVRWHGLDLAIETQAGTMRRGIDANGKPWAVQLAYDYGYFKRTEGADGDAVDVFIGSNLTGDKVFIVNQRNGKGGFDEHKVMLGFESAEAAKAGYLANYSKGWKRYDPDLIEMSVDQFRDWLKDGDTKSPAIEPASSLPDISESAPSDNPIGAYHHKTHPQITVEVVATNKGFSVDWGDGTSSSFTGKSAVKKALDTMEKEGFVKSESNDHQKELPSENKDLAKKETAKTRDNQKAISREEVAAHRIAVAKKEIERDIAAGIIPSNINSFAQLHDYVDANAYVNDAERKDNDIGALGRANKWTSSDYIEFTNELIAQLDDWLANGRAGKSPQDASKPKKAKLESFGEKLEGKRNKAANSLTDATDADIANQPLSKIWPADAYEKIEDNADAALMFAARAEIPAKPRDSRKLERWVHKVKALRGLISDGAFNGEAGQKALLENLRSVRALQELANKIELLTQIDRQHWKRIDDVRVHPDAYTHDKDGNKVMSPSAYFAVDGRRHRVDGAKSVADILDAVESALGNSVAEKKVAFEARRRSNGSIFIMKKGDKEQRSLKEFAKGQEKEALAFMKSNYDDVLSAWNAVKESDNVSKADTRKDTNAPRTGKDHRNGKDATPEMFDKAFGFRGVEFGGWVSQGKNAKERQGMLNLVYDSLHDLADIIGVPPRAISLNGSLGLALGSRGSGNAAAHFERDNLVINLTKTKGAGSLAHEWFHALDNYFSRMRNGEAVPAGREQAYITYKPERGWVKADNNGKPIPYALSLTSAQLRNVLKDKAGYDDSKSLAENAKHFNYAPDPMHKDGVRPQVEAAFAELVEALNNSPMAARATVLDKGAKDGYWSRIIERGARSFENYVINRMQALGYDNDYLANVRSPEEFARNPERYPYLLPTEEQPIVDAFDNLFNTIETREGGNGNVEMYSIAASTRSAYESRIDALFAGAKPNTQEGIRILDRSDMLALLGKNDDPLYLVESKVQKGIDNHPAMTAELWKKIPDWLENPAYVFESETSAGRLVFIAPELVDGQLVRMIVEPRTGGKGLNLLVSAYEAGVKTPLMRWAGDGLMRYTDERATRGISYSARLPRLADAHRSGKKILIGADLFKYRQTSGSQFSLKPDSKKAVSAEKAAVEATSGYWEKQRQADLYSRLSNKYEEEFDNYGTVNNQEVSTEGLPVDEDGDLTEEGSDQYTERRDEMIEAAIAADSKLEGAPIKSLDDIDRFGNKFQAADAAKAWLDAMEVPWHEVRSAGSEYIEIRQPHDEDGDGDTLKLRFSTHENQSHQHSWTSHNWVEGREGSSLIDMLDAARRFSQGETGLGEKWHYSEAPATQSTGLNTEALRQALTGSFLGNDIAVLLNNGRIVLHSTPPKGINSRAEGWTDPDGTVHLVAGNLTAETAMPTLLHEIFHSKNSKFRDSVTTKKLMADLESIYRQYENGRASGNGNKFWNRAMERVTDANTPVHQRIEEFGAYAITEYESAPKSIKDWVDRFVGQVKAYLRRTFGKQFGDITPAQLREMAVHALRTEAALAREQRQNNEALTVEEKSVPYETDLFGNPLPAQTGKANRNQQGKAATANAVFDTPAPDGDYLTRTLVGRESLRHLPVSRITNEKEAAQATAYLFKSAVERLDGIVTDKDGKPLAVIGGFKGAIASANVHDSTLVAEAVRIPGAAHLWLSHNHPSGVTALSDADKHVAKRLMSVFDGSGIKVKGIIAVGRDSYGFSSDGYDSFSGTLEKPSADNAGVAIPVISREVSEDDAPGANIQSPTAAKEIAKQFYQKGGDGIILLNNNHHVIAWVPATPQMMGQLKDTGGLAAIYRAVSEANAAAAILVHGGAFDARIPNQDGRVGGNIAKAIEQAGARPLDSIKITSDGVAVSQTEKEYGVNINDSVYSVMAKEHGITIEQAKQQFKDAERAYGGKEAWQKAKDAGRTKLNYQQWVQVRTPAFKNWFGDWENDPINASKVIDPTTGEPMVVYHGTTQDVSRFEPAKAQHNEVGDYGAGLYFTDDSALASGYAMKRDGASNVVPAHVRLTNPYIIAIDSSLPQERQKFRPLQSKASAQAFTDKLRAQGHDGVIVKLLDTAEPGGEVFGETFEEIVAFDAPQVKSATGNTGQFGTGTDNILYQQGRSDAAYQSAIDGMKGLAEDFDGLFRYARSASRDLSSVVTTVDGKIGFERDSEAERNQARKDTGKPVTDVFALSLPRKDDGKTVYDTVRVYQTAQEVWINAADLKSYVSGGTKIYTAVGDYALNTGRKFIGDPLGLSDEAKIRRTENMLSLAIRHGGTSAMEPHPYQIAPAGDSESRLKGGAVRPLDWQKGNSRHNMVELAKTSLHNVKQFLPEIEDIRYVPATGKFVWQRGEYEGKPVTERQWTDLERKSREKLNEKLSKTGQLGSRVGANERGGKGVLGADTGSTSLSFPAASTLKRAAYINTFVSASAKERATLHQWQQHQMRGETGTSEGVADTDMGEVFYSLAPQPSSNQQTQTASTAIPSVSVRLSTANNAPTGSLFNAPIWQLPEQDWKDRAVQYLQNKFHRVGVLQKAIADAGGAVDLDAKTDPDNAERLFHGQASNDIRLFRQEHVEPLTKFLKDNKLTLEDVGAYLYARHATERNAYIATIDPSNSAGSGMDDATALGVIIGLDQQGKLAALRQVDAMIAGIRDHQLKLMEDSGDYDPQTIHFWKNRYKFYVPLKGLDGTKEKDLLKGSTLPSGYRAKAALVKSALGRRSLADNPLAALLMDTETAIVNYNKSKVREAVLNLALQNPNPDVWEVMSSPPLKRVLRNGQVAWVSTGASAHQDDVFLIKRGGKDIYIQIKDVGLIAALRNLNAEGLNMALRAANVMTTWWKAAVTSASPNFVLTNMAADVMLAEVAMLAEKETGLLAGVNPAAAGKAWMKKELGEVWNLPKRLGRLAWIATLVSRQRFADGGTPVRELLGSDKRWLDLYDEMRAHGGEIGFLGLRDIEDNKKDLERSLSQTTWKNAPSKALHALWEATEKINAGAENATRLMAYGIAREAYGLSPEKAALIARKLTVDFNRRGEQRFIDVLSPFFNAGMQSLHRLDTLIRRGGKVAKKVLMALAGLAMAGYMVTWWNHASTEGYSGDAAGAYVSQVRSGDAMRLMHLAVGGEHGDKQKFVTVRMPHEFSPFWNAGVSLYEGTAGGRPDYAVTLMLSSVGYTLNPFSGGQWGSGIADSVTSVLVPFFGRPFYELDKNRSSFGTPIHKNVYGDPDKAAPASMQGRTNTPQWYKDMALSMNKATGGNEAKSGGFDVYPEDIRYSIRFMGGGALTFWDQLIGGIANKTQGIDVELKDTPIAGRFVREYDMNADRSVYYRYKNVFEAAKGQKKRADDARVDHLLNDVESVLLKARLADRIKQTEEMRKQIDERRLKIRSFMKGQALAAQEKSLDSREREIYQRFNRMAGKAMKNAGMQPLGAE